MKSINQTSIVRMVAILWIVSLVITSCAFFLSPKEVDAAPNAQMNYQGKLLNASGVAVANGTYNMRFWLLASATAPTSSALWTESLTGTNKVQVTNGLFSVMLGSTSPLTSVDFNQTLYLGVEIGSTSAPEWDGEMLPRKILGTVPAAFEANRLDGLDSTQFVRTDATSTVEANTTDALFTITQNGTGDAFRIIDGIDPVFTVADNGRIGVGTGTPFTDFVIDGDFALVGSMYDNNFSLGNNGHILKSTGAGVEWTSTTSLGFFDSTYFDTSAELANILTDETGSGLAVFGTNPLLSGFRSNASSTIGDGTATGGLTISGNSTTTGNAYLTGLFGINTTTPNAQLSITGTGNTNIFQFASSTGSNLLTLDTRGVLTFGTTTNANVFINGGPTSTPFTNTSLLSNNIAIGNEAFSHVSSTSLTENNIALGYQSFYGSSSAPMTGDNNFGAGYQTLYKNTTGFSNIAQGYRALWSNTSGGGNIAVGRAALFGNTTGDANIAQGYEVMRINTTGSYNIAQGYRAMDKNLTGSYNIAQGHEALFSNVAGNDNVAIGRGALYTVQGDFNTGIGYAALNAALGINNTAVGAGAGAIISQDGNANTFLGYGTDAEGNVGLSTTTAIGANAKVGCSNCLVLGGLGADYANVGIGTTTPSRLLTIQGGDTWIGGNLQATGTAQFANMLAAGITISGSSTLGFASTTGLSGTNANITNATTTNLAATASFILGSDYISDITGTGLTLTNGVLSATGDGGSHWLYNGSRLSPSTTVGIGIFASSTIGDGTGTGGLTIAGGATTTGNMYLGGTLNFLNSASPNIFVNGGPTSTSISSSFLQHSVGIGNQALSFVSGASTVFGNVAIGTGVLYGSSSVPMTGDNNFGGGYQTLYNNTTGSNNNAIGRQALYYNTTGEQNVAVGRQALKNNVSGASSTALGANAGVTNISGSNNVFVGDEADALTSALNKATAIGSGAKVGCSNCLVLGGLGANYANVGIGTTTPSRLLTVQGGDAYFGGNITGTGTLSIAGGATTSALYTTTLGLNNEYFTDLTGTGLTLVNGALTVANQSNWLTRNGALVPSTTVGVVVSASSTIGDGTGTGGLTISGNSTTTGNNITLGTASTTNLIVSGITTDSTQCLQISATGLVSGTGSACGAGGGGGVGTWATTTSPVAGQNVNYTVDSNDIVAIGSNATATAEYWFNPNASIAYLSGSVGIGSTSPVSLLTLDKSGLTGPVIGGIKEYLQFTNSTEDAVYYGNNTMIVNAPTATSTLIGSIIRIKDDSDYPNTVRGLEVQAHRGTSTRGENTGINAFGRTFGIKGTTEGDAGEVARPAGVYAETRGSTQGNALRAYSGTLTTEDLVLLYHDTSAFTGTALEMDLGNGGGSFSATSSKFIDLKNAGVSQFSILSNGYTGIGSSTPSRQLTVVGDAYITGNITAASGTITNLLVTSGTTTNATSTNLFATNLRSTYASTTGLSGTNASLTNATTTNLAATASFILGSDYISDITGTGLSLVNGALSATGDGGSHWLYNGSRLTPSSTVGIGIFASSTIGDGTATGGLTISGNSTTTGNAHLTGLLGINTTTPNAQLSITGTGNTNIFQFASSTGSNLLTLDTRGVLTFGTTTTSNVFINGGPTSTPFTDTSLLSNNIAIGNEAFSFPTSTGIATHNIAFGYRALYGSSSVPMTGIQNIALGNSALLRNTTGSNNIAQGYAALASNTTGAENIALGYGSLASNATGTGNIAFGYGSLNGNRGGDNNFAVGRDALQANRGSNNNIGIGYQSLFYTEAADNIGLGYQSMYSNVSGSGNIAFGSQALWGNTTGQANIGIGSGALFLSNGSLNTAVGVNAGITNSTGKALTLLGYTTSASSNNLSTSTAIGAKAIVGCSGCMVLGGLGADAQRVGIGTTTPSRLLTIQGGDTWIGGNLQATGTAQFANMLASGITISGSSTLGFASTTGLSGTNANITNATTTNLAATASFILGSDYISDITGTGLTLTNGVLSATGGGSSNWLFDGTRLTPSTSPVGIVVTGSSTIGGGTGATGLTISGNATTTGNAYLTGLFGINTTTPNAQLSITGTGNTNIFQFASSTGSNLLTLDTRGVLTFGTTTSSNVFINGGPTSTPFTNTSLLTSNVAIGNQAFSYPSSASLTESNIALGYRALYGSSSVPMTGDDNFAVGDRALYNNTTGSSNNAQGNLALFSNTSGMNNIAIGDQTLTANITGSDNIALGDTVLLLNTTGTDNIGLGQEVLYNSNGSDNIALGETAMYSNTTGSHNIALGGGSSLYSNGALFNNLTGSYNIALGLDALSGNTTGSSSIGIGQRALFSNVSGASSTALGAFAGFTNVTGSNNLYLGDEADATGGGFSNAIAIGSHAKVGRSGALVLGGNGVWNTDIITGSSTPYAKFSIQNNYGSTTALFDVATTTSSSYATSSLFRINADGNVGIGTTSPSALLSITGTGNKNIFQFASSTGSNVLTLDTRGVLTFGTSSSADIFVNSGSTTANPQANKNNIAIGNGAFLYASTTVTPQNNIAIGFQALLGSSTASLSGDNNIAIGYQSLANNASGTNNVAIGYLTLAYNSSGSANTAVGYGSSLFNTTGYQNTAVGVSSLQANTTGYQNAAVGYGALLNNTLGTNNAAMGWGALAANTDGVESTAFGASALLQSTGSYNTAQGYRALYANTSGVGNTAVGWQALIGNDTGLGNTGVGYGAISGNTSGLYNTALGITAGTVNTIGNANTYIGRGANASANNFSTSTAIGANATVACSNCMVLGGLNSDYVNVGIGTTTPTALLTLDKSALTGGVVGGIKQTLGFTNSTLSAVYYGNETYITNVPTATSTLIGSIIRVADTSQLGNTVRAFEAQAFRGTNTKGENTGLSGFGRTFGVRGTTLGDAGDTFLPAGVFAETEGTTQGNALRAYSGTITTEDLVSIFHDTSAFTGTGLQMNFGNAGGSFAATTSAKFLDLQVAGTSKFTVSANGSTTIGDGTVNAGLRIPRGGICVDNDGSCISTTTGEIRSVTSVTGNSDLAEIYFSSQALHAGEIVSLKGGLSIERAEEGAEGDIIGVVSTKPGLLLGFDDTSLIPGETGYPVGLKGRVPIKLSTENGPIKKGDRIMLSSIPGVGMKAEGNARVVGIAMEDYDGTYGYSAGFLNQFGDDLAKERSVARKTETDLRTQDGCYYGGGNAQGEKACKPKAVSGNALLAATSTEPTREEILAELRNEPALTMNTEEGERVSIGQAIMFIELTWHQAPEGMQVLTELTATSSLIDWNGKEGETLWDRVKGLAQNFVDGVLSITGLKADKVEVKNELCVDGVCMNADDLRALLQSVNRDGNSTSPSPTPTPVPDTGNGGGGDTSEPPVDNGTPTETPSDSSDGGGEVDTGSPDPGGSEAVDDEGTTPIEPEVTETPQEEPEPPTPEPEPEPEPTPEPQPAPESAPAPAV